MFGAIKSLYKGVKGFVTGNKQEVSNSTNSTAPVQNKQSVAVATGTASGAGKYTNTAQSLNLKPTQVQYIEELIQKEPEGIRELKREEYTTEALKIVKNRQAMQQKKQDRIQQMKQIIETTEDPQEKSMMLQQYRLQSLVDHIKEKEKLDPSVDDKQVLDTINKWVLESRPNDGAKIVEDFLNNKSDDLYMLTEYGKTRKEYDDEKNANMSLGEKAIQTGKNILGGVGDSITGVGQLLANTVGDAGIQGIAQLMKQSGVDDVTVKRFVDGWEQEKQNNKISSTSGSDTNSIAYQGTKFVGDMAQVLAPTGSIIGGSKVASFVSKIPGAGRLSQIVQSSPKWVQSGLKLAGQGATDTIKYDAIANGEIASAKDIALGAGLNVGMGAVGSGIKGLLNSVSKPLYNKNELISKVTNVKEKDIDKAINVINNIDTKDVNNFKDLSNVISNKQSAVMSKIDDILSSNTKVFKPSETIVTTASKKIEGVTAQTNPVKKALNDLLEQYSKAGDDLAVAELNAVVNKYDEVGLTAKEINNIAKEYGSVRNAFNMNGELASGLNKQSRETTRKQLKQLVRESVGGDELQKLDGLWSNLESVGDYVSSAREKAFNLANKVEKKGLVNKIGGKIGEVVDTLTGGGVKGFFSKFIQSNNGNKSFNYLEMEQNLPKYIKMLDKVESLVDADATKQEIYKATNELLKLVRRSVTQSNTN